MPRLFEHLRGFKWASSSYKPSKFAGLKGKVSQLPISVAMPEEEPEPEIVPVTEPDEQPEEPEEQQIGDVPFGEIRPFATDLRKYLGPSWDKPNK